MKGLLQTVEGLPNDTVLFASARGPVTAGRIRATATGLASRPANDGPLFLHTASASRFVAGLLAASRAGWAVCFPAHSQPDYLREISADSDAILTDATIKLSEESEAPCKIEYRDLDLVFYTSGVTGAPKLVRKKLSQLDSEAHVLDRLWGAKAGHTFATVSHQHIYGMLFRIFWPVLGGRISEDLPVEYWESLSGKLGSGTTLISSPAHLTRLAVDNVFSGSYPGLVFSSGAPLPFAAAQAAREAMGSLPIEVLGCTETGGIGWRQQERADALWTPLPEVQIEAGDGAMRVTSPFAGDAVPTGDLVESVGDKFRLKGRADRIVKVEGKRVSLQRVEEALLAQPMISAATAIDLPSRKGALGAIVELNAAGRAVLAEEGAFRLSRSLRSGLASRLEPGERPKHWRFEPIPVNRQGKRVQEMVRARFEAPPGMVVNRDEQTAEIAMSLELEWIWFDGHFPERPVLPGIAQVHLASQWAEHLWSWRPNGANLAQLKFRQILRPGDEVRLALSRDAAQERLTFAYRLGDIVASQGIIGGAA